MITMPERTQEYPKARRDSWNSPSAWVGKYAKPLESLEIAINVVNSIKIRKKTPSGSVHEKSSYFIVAEGHPQLHQPSINT